MTANTTANTTGAGTFAAHKPTELERLANLEERIETFQAMVEKLEEQGASNLQKGYYKFLVSDAKSELDCLIAEFPHLELFRGK